MMRMRKPLILFLLFFQVLVLFGQEPVSLNDCQQWAREYHPLLKQKELYSKIAALNLENNEANYLPKVSLNAQATYQTDVTRVGISLPNVPIPEQAKDQYKAYLDVKQTIWDGGLTKAGEILEKAREQSNLHGVEVELYKVNKQVNSLFFASFLIQQNIDLLLRKQETLESRREKMESAVKNGVLLEADLNQIQAELIKTKQQQLELQSQRETVLSALAILTGKTIEQFEQLKLEDSELNASTELGRPELDYFEKQSDLLAASFGLMQKKRNPKLFGFGQAGYGRPGLNMLSNEFDTYALVGVGLNWSVFDWKTTRREKEVIQLKQQLIDTQQNQFKQNIKLALDSEYRKIQQLKSMLESDRELIALQESISKSSASKLENGTITSSDYIQDINAEIAARITFDAHKTQLEAAKINYQNIQGNKQ